MRRPNRRPNYLEPEDINNFNGLPDYIVFRRDGGYWARNQTTGEIVSKGATADIPINYAITNPINPTDEGTHIHLKYGQFVIADKLNFNLHPNASVILTGEGKGFDRYWTQIYAQDDLDQSMILLAGTFSEIRNLMIHGNNYNVTIGDSIAGGSLDATIDNVILYRSAGSGISLENSKHTVIRDVWVEYPHNNGIEMLNSPAYLGTDKIVNCHVVAAGQDGIKSVLSGSKGSTLIEGCSIAGNGTRIANAGISLVGATRAQIIGNNIATNDNMGIELRVSGATECSHNVIANNIIQDSGGDDQDYGIKLLNVTAKTTIVGNVFFDNVIDDISIAGTCTDTFCDNNGIADIPFTGVRTRINGIGYETADAEAPADAAWQIGEIVNFVDSGDGSGDGIYIKDTAGNFVKLT